MKRFLTLLMTVVMAVSMLSAFAFAANETCGCPETFHVCRLFSISHHYYKAKSYTDEYHVMKCIGGIDPYMPEEYIYCDQSYTEPHSFSFKNGMLVCHCGYSRSANCGDNATWSLDKATGTLTITGTGDVTYRSGWTSLKTQVKKIVVEEGITSLPYCSFYYFSAQDITLPASLKSIGASAFALCSNLKTVNYSGTAKEWATVSIGTNNKCLTDVAPAIADYEYSWAYDDETATLTVSGNGVLPDFASKEAPWFEYASTAKAIVVEEGITEISNNAFAYFVNAETVSLPATLKTIGVNAFYRCQKLAEVVIPDAVSTIKSGAFSYSKAVASVTIPASVTEIGSYAFYGCDAITEVNYTGTDAQWDAINIKTGNDVLAK